MPSSQDRINRALDSLAQGLSPFVEREMQAAYGESWIEVARGSFREDRGQAIHRGEMIRWDSQALLTVMWDQWNNVFRQKLGHLERSLVSELREFRNRWAHQQEFSFEDTYRLLDSAERLLAAIGAAESQMVGNERRTLMQEEVADELNQTTQALNSKRAFVETLIVYMICGAALAIVIWQSFGSDAWIGSVLVMMLFGLLTYKRLQSTPVSLGPHECPRCHRIIYSTLCPYCQSEKRDLRS